MPAGAGAPKQDNEDNWIKLCVFALSGRIEGDSGDNLAEAAQTCPAAGKEEGGGERGRGRGVRRPAGPSLERPTQHPPPPFPRRGRVLSSAAVGRDRLSDPLPLPPRLWGLAASRGGGGKMAWEVKRPAVEGADASSRGWRGDSVGG